MNFKESVMSVTPKNLPKRTRILSKDLLFQEKYHLTDTQVDIMSYIFNAFTWAMKVNGYIILTTKKITEDMPQIGEKTLDASLRELEKKGLIGRKIVKIAHWENARVRGIKISLEGMEYNSSLYAPSHQAIIEIYQNRIDELEKRERERENELQHNDQTTATKIQKSSIKTQQKSGKDIRNTNQTRDGEQSIKEENCRVAILEDFIKKVRNRFILTSEPICNMVDGWQKESTFYINSYGKLSVTTQNMDFIQLKNPLQINKFWRWLFDNQHRIGTITDFNSSQTLLKNLNIQYKNLQIKIANKERWIEDILLIKDKFAIRTKDKNGTVFIISDNLNQPILYNYHECKKYILKLKL